MQTMNMYTYKCEEDRERVDKVHSVPRRSSSRSAGHILQSCGRPLREDSADASGERHIEAVILNSHFYNNIQLR